MVIKTFCDECDKELKAGEDVVGNRVVLKTDRGVEFQVLVAKEGTWNAGALCLACAKKMFSTARISKS